MRDKTLSTFILILLFLLVMPRLFAENDLTLTYRQMHTARTLELQLDAPDILYCLKLRQDHASGLFTLEAPPFLVAQIDGRIRIGEIQDDGILSMMLSPMTAQSNITGFRSGINFKDISKPAFQPTLSGIALSFDEVDIIALSPVFNPTSPYGFGFVGGDRHFFAGLMFATQNERTIARATEKFQVNWRQLGTGRHMMFSIIGAGGSSDSYRGVRLTGSVAFQNSWDTLLGGGSTSIWHLGLSSEKLDIKVGRRLGGYGVKLKKLNDSDNPIDLIEMSLWMKDGSEMSMVMEYQSMIYQSPVYGGESQRRNLLYSISASYGDFSVRARSTTDYDMDRGKVSKTVYSLSGKAMGASASLQMPVFRPIDHSCYLADVAFSLRTEHADLRMEAGRTSLQFEWEYLLDGCTVKLAIDQDRAITASLRFIGL